MRQKYYVFYNWKSDDMRMKYDAVQGVVADDMKAAETAFLESVESDERDNCYVNRVMTEYQYNVFLASKGPYS